MLITKRDDKDSKRTWNTCLACWEIWTLFLELVTNIKMEDEVAWDKINVILYVFVLVVTDSLYWSLLFFFWSSWYTLECCVISLVACNVFQNLSSRKYSKTLSIKHSCSILFFFKFFKIYMNFYLNYIFQGIWIFVLFISFLC